MSFLSRLKICMGAFACCFALCASPAGARVPYSCLNIGGLTPDQDISSCYGVYGRPTDTLIVKGCDGFSIYEATYDSELIVYYVRGGYNEDRRIRAVLCAEDNIGTNRGIRVGMTQNDVEYAYGEPDRRFDETGGSSWCYLASSEDHPNMPLWFFFDEKGIIHTITIGDIGYY